MGPQGDQGMKFVDKYGRPAQCRACMKENIVGIAVRINVKDTPTDIEIDEENFHCEMHKPYYLDKSNMPTIFRVRRTFHEMHIVFVSNKNGKLLPMSLELIGIRK